MAVGGVTLTPQAHGAGATYNLYQCHFAAGKASNQAAPPFADPGYDARDVCGQPIPDWSYQLTSVQGAGYQRAAAITFLAPDNANVAAFRLDLDARSADNHFAEVQVVHYGGGATTVHRATDGPGGYTEVARGDLAEAGIRIILFCANSGGCQPSSAAHAFVRNVNIAFRDVQDPAVNGSGSLLSGGWKRGAANTLSASGTDPGAGVRYLDAIVNGVPLGAPSGVNCQGNGPPFASPPITVLKVPCLTAAFSISPDTAAAPFQNGHNKVELRVQDFPGNQIDQTHTVKVDNASPVLGFANSQDAEDPELIRAPVSDQHSGISSAELFIRPDGSTTWQPLETTVNGGEARARIDSSALPAGEYEFKAIAVDAAGNTVETTSRQNGEPMKLTFPLRAGVELQAHLDRGGSRGQTVPYGTDAAAVGRLLDASGQALADKQITVIEHFGRGALIRRRVSRVTTNERGRWRSKVPAGPSRSVDAVYAGSPKFMPNKEDVGKLAVKGRVSFETSSERVPEGEAVVFRGKVGHFGARIPAGGKLIELQVRLRTGRWDTVKQAFRTRETGRYKTAYRFGKHYSQAALFRFRVKVTNEARWPFKRSASRQRKVVVQAR